MVTAFARPTAPAAALPETETVGLLRRLDRQNKDRILARQQVDKLQERISELRRRERNLMQDGRISDIGHAVMESSIAELTAIADLIGIHLAPLPINSNNFSN